MPEKVNIPVEVTGGEAAKRDLTPAAGFRCRPGAPRRSGASNLIPGWARPAVMAGLRLLDAAQQRRDDMAQRSPLAAGLRNSVSGPLQGR